MFVGVFFGAAVLVVGLLVYFSVGGFDVSSGVLGEPPSVLGGYSLLDYRIGGEAVEDLGGVHSFLPGEPALIDALVAIYVRGSDIIHIWVAVFGSSDDAAALAGKMYTKISEGESPYTPPEEFEVDGVTVYFGSGSSMNYYFFHYGNAVVWISTTDPETVETRVIRELFDYLA